MSKQVRLLRRISVFLCAAALSLFPALAAEPDNSFLDVPMDAWYAQSVYYVQAQGLMAGTGAGTFSPNLPMTRGMLLTVLYRVAGSPILDEASLGTPFSDVPQDTWYADGIYWARSEGIASGYSEEEFGPNDSVTREQLVTMLWRYSGSPQSQSDSAFSDEAAISVWADTAVSWASSNGLVSGTLGNLFEPAGLATRAQAAVILTNYDQQVPQEQPEPEPEPEPVPQPEPEPVPDPDPEPTPEPEPPDDSISTLLPNTYDSSAFVVENGFLTYQGDVPSYVGIDVSAHQNLIDWDRVAAAGVDFVMIRAGYRGYTQGIIHQDDYFEYNINEALRAGLDVGIYFFSQATSVEEAREEALQTLEWIADYDITYPVVFDWERIDQSDSRTQNTTGDVITACAQGFCSIIADAGYTPMTYGSPSKVGKDLQLSQLSDYPFWLAHYTIDWRPTSFQYHYDMWQYSSSGSVDGIEGRVDLNLCLRDW